jgi:hypothetical protein
LDTITVQFLQGPDLYDLSGGSMIVYATMVTERLNVLYGRSTLAPVLGAVISTERRRTYGTMPKYGGRYAHAHARLFLVVHNLCGCCFEHPHAQQVLSILASCASISMLATIDDLNVGLQWDTHTQRRFNWRLEHLATFSHHRAPIDHPLLITSEAELRKATKDPPSGDALLVVLRTFTRNHRDFLQTICRKLLADKDTVTEVKVDNKRRTFHMLKFILFSTAVLLAKDALVAKSEKELKKLLVEFVDHSILQIEEENNKQLLRVLLSDQDVIVVANTQI